MIRLAEGPLAPQFWQLAEQWGIFGTKLYAQGRIYGLSGGPLEVWLLLAGERPVGALSRLGGAFCLAGGRAAPAQGPTQDPAQGLPQAQLQGLPQAQLLELARFLPLVGGRCLEGPLPAVQQLAAHLRCQLKLSVRSLDICCASGTLHKKSPDRSTQFFRLSSSNSCFL